MPTGVYKRTKEMYATRIGRVGYWRGKKRPEMAGENNPSKRAEVRVKISEQLKGRPSWNTGGKQTAEWTEKIRIANLGKKRTIESRKKMSDVHIGLQAGSKHPNWRGGISKNPYPIEFNKRVKYSIRERDGFACVLCGMTESQSLQRYGRILSVNHIDYNKKNCNPDNLNTLCCRCNIVVNYGRDSWTARFQNVSRSL